MSSGEDYLKEVVKMIDDLINEAKDQAGAALTTHQKERSLCKKLIPEYTQTIKKNNKQAEQCDSIIKSTKAALKDTEEMLATTMSEL